MITAVSFPSITTARTETRTDHTHAFLSQSNEALLPFIAWSGCWVQVSALRFPPCPSRGRHCLLSIVLARLPLRSLNPGLRPLIYNHSHTPMRTICLSKFASPCLTLALLYASAAQTTPRNPSPNPSALQSQSMSSANAQSLGDAEMADRVRQEFRHAWEGYKHYAWGHDALKPLSKSSHDWYGVPLLMSPVDALDTMILMGMNDEASQTREYIVKNLTFDRDIYIKNFEITIRLLGGLLSSYQLTGDKRLLALADDLGTRLLPAFNSPTGMPYVFVNLKTGAVRGETTNPAEVGTLLLEFGTLSS